MFPSRGACVRQSGPSGPSHVATSLVLALVLSQGLGAGCSGSAGGRQDDGDQTPAGMSPGGKQPGGKTPGGNAGGGSGNGGVTDPGPTEPGVSAGVAPLRRLTADQYRNSVRDLLGLKDTVPTTALPADETLNDRFATNIVRPLQDSDLGRYADAAAGLAQKAAANLQGVVPCDPARGDAACAMAFIDAFGRRAYRRPLTGVEAGRLKALYDAGESFTDGVRLVIEGILQSPNFLYLIEPFPANATGKVVALDGWSVAARLSYLFWNSTPDDALLTAAGAGQLAAPEGIATQAARLMASEHFTETAAAFHTAWLGLTELTGADKDAQRFPLWNDQLKATMALEAPHFVAYVLREGDGRLDTLLGAHFSFLSGSLYDVYGVAKPAAAMAATWQRVDLKPGERAGLLTQPGLLAGLAKADRTSYVRRGKMVREALFCADIPPPPPGVNDSDEMIPVTATARERAAQHRKSPDCASCHEQFDPIGFAFENYDAIGRYRTVDEAGKGIDATATISDTAKLDGPIKNVLDLIQKLGSDSEVRACVARQWMRFALGRNETEEDEPSIKGAVAAFGANDGKVADLLIALARSDSFRHQKVR
jgi:hypothetical protein